MHNTFLTLVSIYEDSDQINKKTIDSLDNFLREQFSEYEIIIVNNGNNDGIISILNKLKDRVKKNITVLHLSKKVDYNNAIFAGLDQANGDYTLMLDIPLWNNLNTIKDLFKKVQNGYDVVYIKQLDRKLNFIYKKIHKIIYFLINKFSNITVDMNMSFNFIISRRALNSFLQIRERQYVLKAFFGVLGYATSFIQLDYHKKEKFSLISSIKDVVMLITYYTNILNKILFITFISSSIFSIIMLINALIVKFYSLDIFGNKVESVPGWTYIIVMNSITFSLLILILYVFSIYLSSIQNSVKKGPLYFIKSIDRL